MIEHLLSQQEKLESEGIVSSYYNDGDTAILSWYDQYNQRHAMSIWIEEEEAFYSVVKTGQQNISEAFTKDEFLKWSAI